MINVQVTVRQSTIKEFRMCPERVRTDLAGLHPPESEKISDATVVGTALHTFAEATLHQLKAEGRDGLTFEFFLSAQEAANAVLAEAAGDGVRLTHAKDWNGAVRRLGLCCDQWLVWFLANLDAGNISGRTDDWLIEERFSLPVPGTSTTLQGTIDFFDGNIAFDWKTGAVPMAWEMDRYDVQSTMYLTALRMMGHSPQSFVFVYCGGHKSRTDGGLKLGSPPLIEVFRHDGHTAAMMDEISSMADMAVKYGLERPWPIRPNGWHCSAKWCCMWKSCVGRHYQEQQEENEDGVSIPED